MDKDKRYFVYDPEGDGMAYFDTMERAHAYAEECIQAYLDGDEWPDTVKAVTAGVVTHAAQEINRVDRPADDEIDEDGLDPEGNYWDPDWPYVCNYALLPITGEKP